MSTWNAGVAMASVAGAGALFGLGFGLTVTPRSTAAVEAVDRTQYGAASATVTVARMIGMAIGLAVLTAYGSTAINRFSAQVFASPDAYRSIVPPALADHQLRDPLVIGALEGWAASQAAETMVVLFAVAGVVGLLAVPPGLVLGRRPRMLRGAEADRPPEVSGGGAGGDDGAEPEPAVAR